MSNEIKKVRLFDFIALYGLGYGNDLISIKGYCEELTQEEVLESDWYNDIKNRTIERWQTIGGGIYPVEICIELNNSSEEGDCNE